MAKIVDLYENKWLTVKEKTLDNGCQYVYAHAGWCGGEGIAILPFRRKVVNDWGYEQPEFLGRFEVCPAHSEDIELCSITGGMDKVGESALMTAVRELEEEAGYRVNAEDVISLGTVKSSKASDTLTHVFAVDFDKTNPLEVEAVGDGTIGEENAYCSWVSLDEITNAKDPILHAILIRVMNKGLRMFYI